MTCHVEITIWLNLKGEQNLHHVLRHFAVSRSGWTFPQKESEVYQSNIGGEGGYLLCERRKDVKPALVAIATAKTKRPTTFYVANIVPRDCFQLTIAEYNAIASVFIRDFRRWMKTSPVEGSVHCTSANKALADIIPGEKCRGFFERFLACDILNSRKFPSHPSDVEKLDVFICALFRYGADVHADELERFLVADKQWRPADAAWVRRRIETGLDVLKMDRRF